jgi:DHA1 family bicyclomycin/chloramphenicol resistance-like MFS transporter
MFMAGLFAYIAGAPFVFVELFRMSPQKFALFFGANAFGMVLMSRLNVVLSRSLTTNTIIQRFLVIQSVAAFLLVAGTGTGWLGPYGTAALIFVYIASLGCLFPNTTAMAMSEQQARAGSASALLGTLQFGLAAISSTVVSRTNNGTAMPVVTVIFACGISALLLHRSLCYASTQNRLGATG